MIEYPLYANLGALVYYSLKRMWNDISAHCRNENLTYSPILLPNSFAYTCTGGRYHAILKRVSLAVGQADENRGYRLRRVISSWDFSATSSTTQLLILRGAVLVKFQDFLIQRAPSNRRDRFVNALSLSRQYFSKTAPLF